MTKASCQDKQTVAFYLDVAKASYRVWHEGVLQKFKDVLLPDWFLGDRTFHVRTVDTLSSERRITADIPQGSVFGPLMFSVFVNDVPREAGVWPSLFADGTAVYAAAWHEGYAAMKLQSQLDAYPDWTVAVNASKSTAVVFTRGRKWPRRLTMGNTDLPWANQVK